MKAKDWEFKKIIPDGEDCDAAVKACSGYLNVFDKLAAMERIGSLDKSSVDAFHTGFMRGLAWAKAKYDIKE
jgi:hypothetical protein